MDKNFTQKIIQWSSCRNGFVRLPVLLWFFYIFVKHLQDPMYCSFLTPLNLAIHELGHVIFSPFGFFINIAGGTIAQLLAPLFGIYNFYKQSDYFAITLCFGWLATNFYHIAVYVADARVQALDLVSLSTGKIYHDWNYLLSKMNLLAYDYAIASFLRVWAAGLMLLCLVLGSWIIFLMFRRYFI